MSHIKLQNLSIAYGANCVIHNIDVEIPNNQIIAIIGPSGCGKSTLLKSLNRLLDLYENTKVTGEVFIDGTNIYDPDADILVLRKKVGFLSQRPYPLPMSIYENVAFGPNIQRLNYHQILQQITILENSSPTFASSTAIADAAKSLKHRRHAMDFLVEYYLRRAGLWEEVKDRLNEPAVRLSIGQQQRLALARSLAVEPEVILADEPTSALDPISAKIVEDQFRLLKNDYTIIMVTHILRQARRLADYVIFIYMGELVEHGPAEQFFASPKDERTQAYISGAIS
ncbi:MAG: phosphate ABC transporter ATP-binding protein [Syntrophorhabdaceae bacterium]